MNKNLTIRNSTTEFLIFTTANGEDTIEVKVEDETVWLTQKLIAKLFDINVATINEHLKKIFRTNELEEKSTIRKFLIVQKEGKREVSRNIDHYNLEVIISLGYRINSKKATEFRRWATQVLKTFTTRGYVLDNERLKNARSLSDSTHQIKSNKMLK
ncbi:MAG: RhuM family protein [Sulfurimonas sp.]|nr:RhuM family protein [Sulfurimonas sp.]